jgi:hypothetical protein
VRQDAVLFEELKVYLQLQRRLREAVTWPKGPLRLGLIFSPTLLLKRVLYGCILFAPCYICGLPSGGAL